MAVMRAACRIGTRRRRVQAALRAAMLPLAVSLPLLAASCGAPPSEPIQGPVSEAVGRAIEQGQESFDHSVWDRLLAEGTQDGLVDYRYFQDNRDQLDAYLDRIANARLDSLAPEALHALLINAYNALTVRAILDHPHVSSIREIDGVWTELTHTVGGYELTLDEIEHNIIRPFFKDPRIHFAANCASLSCAPLPPWAFTGEHLDEQLEERTRAFLTDPDNVRVDDGTLYLSRYFDWYGDDFTAPGWSPRAETIPEFVARYARPEVAEAIQTHVHIRFLKYDWSLNAAVRPDAGS